MLGLITTVGMSWSLAMWRTVPMYPAPSQVQITERAFVKWNRGWSVMDKHLIGVTDSWWTDLGFDDPDLSPQAQVELNKENFAKRQPNNPFLGNASHVDQPPSWWTCAVEEAPQDDFQIGCDTAFGWPRPCLWFSTMANLIHIPRGIQTTNPVLAGGIFVQGTIDCPGYLGFRALPLRPIWNAVAIDVAIYTSLWSIILFTPGPLRRMHRRRHNRCEQCGYSLAGNPALKRGCPECGWNRTFTPPRTPEA